MAITGKHTNNKQEISKQAFVEPSTNLQFSISIPCHSHTPSSSIVQFSTASISYAILGPAFLFAAHVVHLSMLPFTIELPSRRQIPTS
ncbi:hypothetical protein VTL71DRAFT_3602 [Oculimacula yallundae]|uniref:Uncharacterized protein n=1 Tax=Oculimacula yallundae TaxID=86028 RepID=A0ABR4C7N1_9HELO